MCLEVVMLVPGKNHCHRNEARFWGSMSRYPTYLQNRNTISKTIPQKYKIFAHFIACNMFGPQCTIGGQIKSNSRMVIKLD